MEHRIHSDVDDAQSLDTLFSLLSNRRRRYVVDFLSERDSPVSLDELATAVTAWETESDDVSAETTDEVLATLHHVHLPKLDDTDVVDYDVEEKAVIPARTEIFTPFLELLDGVR